MARRRGETNEATKGHPLPFTTFASIAELGLEVHVYSARCFALRRIDPLADAVRDREFVGARFVCRRCGSIGMPQLQGPNQLIAGGPVTLLYLWCNTCLWEAKGLPVDDPPWNVIRSGRGAQFVCPGCRRPAKNHFVEPAGPGGVIST
jgi:hypothetical protein